MAKLVRKGRKLVRCGGKLVRDTDGAPCVCGGGGGPCGGFGGGCCDCGSFYFGKTGTAAVSVNLAGQAILNVCDGCGLNAQVQAAPGVFDVAFRPALGQVCNSTSDEVTQTISYTRQFCNGNSQSRSTKNTIWIQAATAVLADKCATLRHAPIQPVTLSGLGDSQAPTLTAAGTNLTADQDGRYNDCGPYIYCRGSQGMKFVGPSGFLGQPFAYTIYAGRDGAIVYIDLELGAFRPFPCEQVQGDNGLLVPGSVTVQGGLQSSGLLDVSARFQCAFDATCEDSVVLCDKSYPLTVDLLLRITSDLSPVINRCDGARDGHSAGTLGVMDPMPGEIDMNAAAIEAAMAANPMHRCGSCGQ